MKKLILTLIAVLMCGMAQANDLYEVIATRLNIRNAPSTSATVIGGALKGDLVEVIEARSNGWAAIDYRGKLGYVSTRYLKFVGHLDEKPEDEPMDDVAEEPTTNKSDNKNDNKSDNNSAQKSKKGNILTALTKSANNSENEHKTELYFDINYGILAKIKGVSGTNWAYSVNIGAIYTFYDKAFASAGLGYNSANSNSLIRVTAGEYVSSAVNVHMIDIPLLVGYTLETPDKKFAIVPNMGLGTNISLCGKNESKHGSEKYTSKKGFGGKVGFDFQIGLRFRIYGLNIIGMYHCPMNDNQKKFFGKKAYPSIGIGWGF